MATTTPLAYNPTSDPIAGTTQVGQLAVGTTNQDYSISPGGVTWWMGPDEDLGYVIGVPVSGNTQPTEISGVSASVGFFRSEDLTDNSFIGIAEYVANEYGSPQTFSSASDASIWLTNNGFWNTFTSITPTPTPSITPTNTPTVTPTPTTSPIPVTGYGFNLIVLPYNFPATGNTIMNQGAVQTGTTNPNELTISGRGIYFNSIDSDGIDRTSYFSQFTGQSITITMTQTGSTAIYSGDTNAFKYWSATTGTPPGVAGDGFVFGTQVGVPPLGTPSGNAVLIQSATTNWTVGLPVYISAVNNNPSVTPTPTATSVTPTPTPTSGASANFNITVSQVGPNVVWSGSGSFNLTSLTLNQNIPGVTGGYNKSFAQFIVGPTSPVNATTYSGSSFTTFPTNFGSGPGTAPSSSSGSFFGVVQTEQSGPREVLVPQGYASGTVISGSMTYDSQTIAGMGLTPGTYTWAWGTGGNASSIVMTINS
jgi:hypothetical protein